MRQIFVINPGSTSTKVALFREHEKLWQENIEHSAEDLKAFPTIFSQLDFRIQVIGKVLESHDVDTSALSAIMSRGGLLPPVHAGAYEVTEDMLDVLENHPVNEHASNLGAAIAYRMATKLGIKAYIYDPVTVDEMIELVRITGIKEIRRHGQGHNLNMRAAALKYCQENHLAYNSQNLIVVHLGGGITLTLHSGGRIIDMISDDDGAFSPERAGEIPTFKLAALIDRNHYSYKEIMKVLQRKSGLTSLLGEPDVRKVEARIAEGDAEADLVHQAMALSVARAIAKLAVVVDGQVDAIVLTGGIAFSQLFTERVAQRVRFIAPVTVIPGENEMQALADGALRVLDGTEAATVYVSPFRR